jgi:hypothetical protein
MPCISRFYGIVIYLYADDHNPPHFHARYAGQDVAVDIATLDVLVGRLPHRAMRLVLEWAALHRAELMENWNRLQAGESAFEVEPLP